MTQMSPLRGPSQVGGTVRWYGWRSSADRDEAARMARRDPAAWDAIRPDAIIDRDPERPGMYWPIGGSDESCRALARVTREEGSR